MNKMKAERSGGMAHVARRLDEQGLLHADVTVDWAAHVLWVLTSFEAFDLLHTDRGLPVDDVIDMTIRTAEAALCTVDAGQQEGGARRRGRAPRRTAG